MTGRIDILARLHPDISGGRNALIRWVIPDMSSFPERGFTLTMTIGAVSQTLFQDHKLPGAKEVAPDAWIIDDNQLTADYTNRVAASPSVRFQTLHEFAQLKLLFLFALPQPDWNEIDNQLSAVAEQFGDSHEKDPKLEKDYWEARRPSPPPTRAELSALRRGDPSAYYAVVRHYQDSARTRLQFAANDFGMAILLGVGAENPLPPGALGSVGFTVKANWGPDEESQKCQMSELLEGPLPPILNPIEQGKGYVGYPAFKSFYEQGTSWRPQASTAPAFSSGLGIELVAAVRDGPRTYETPTARLTWKVAADTEPDDSIGEDVNSENPESENGSGLVSEPVLWEIERYSFGAHTAVLEHAPALDPVAVFVTCHDADPLLRGEENLFVDDIDLPWGENPLEGWFAYRIRSIDIFGVPGPESLPELVRLRDSYPPDPPRLRISQTPIVLPALGPSSLMLGLEWHMQCEFAAPDAKEFRVYQHWTTIQHQALLIVDVRPITGPLNNVQADVLVKGGRGETISRANLEPFVGGTLLTADGEFAILGALGDSELRIRRSAGRVPSRGSASVRYASRETQIDFDETLDVLRRTEAITGVVKVSAVNPLSIEVLQPTAMNIPSRGRVYLHLLQMEVPYEGLNDILTLDLSGTNQRFLAINSLTLADAGTFLDGSPAVILPYHSIEVTLRPPGDFVAGTLRLAVSAADGASYVSSSSGTGNEGSCSDVILPARRNLNLAPVQLEWIPRHWARGAAEFIEDASCRISWPAIRGAVRYEVERALESALGLSARVSEYDLLTAASARSADYAYERITNAAFLPFWEDLLPGRAPTRAVYRVRGVSSGGTSSDWQVVALVRVPDVRIAPMPTLLRAIPAPQRERAILLTWTQPGPKDGIGFSIEARPINLAAAGVDEFWQSVSDFLPNAIAPDNKGRFEAVLPENPPGLWQEFRIVPVRHALDPEDPRARLLRRIDGRPSNLMRARAEGELRAPDELQASLNSDGIVELRWQNRDRYAGIEVRCRPTGNLVLQRFNVAGDAEVFRPELQILDPDEWTVELAAIGYGRRAFSTQVVPTRRAE